jgi:hypothetical protein
MAGNELKRQSWFTRVVGRLVYFQSVALFVKTAS